MSQIGIKFESNSFRVFTEQVQKLNNISREIDKNLKNLGDVTKSFLNEFEKTKRLKNIDEFTRYFDYFLNTAKNQNSTAKVLERISSSLSSIFSTLTSLKPSNIKRFVEFNSSFEKFINNSKKLNENNAKVLKIISDSILNFANSLKIFETVDVKAIKTMFTELFDVFIKGLDIKISGSKNNIFIIIEEILERFARAFRNANKIFKIASITAFNKSFTILISEMARVAVLMSKFTLDRTKINQNIQTLQALIGAFTRRSIHSLFNPIRIINWFRSWEAFGGVGRTEGIFALLDKVRYINVSTIRQFQLTITSLFRVLETINNLSAEVGKPKGLNREVIRQVTDYIRDITRVFSGVQTAGITGFLFGRTRRFLGFGYGLLDDIQKFSTGDFSNFNRIGNALRDFIISLNEISNIRVQDISETVIKDIRRSITSLAEIFIGSRGGLIGRVVGSVSSLIQLNPGRAFRRFFKDMGILKNIQGVDVQDINKLYSFAQSLEKFSIFLSEIQTTRLSTQTTNILRRNINEITNIFTNRSGIMFWRNSIIGKLKNFSMADFDKLEAFTKAITRIVSSFRGIDIVRINNESINNFANAYSNLIRKLLDVNRQLKGQDFSNMEKLSVIIKNLQKAMTRDVILDQSDAFYKKGKGEGKDYVRGFNDALERKSPSKVFIRIGKDIVKGLEIGTKGILEPFKNIKNKIVSTFQNMKASVSGVWDNIKSKITITLGDIINLAERFRRNFYNALIGNAIQFESAFTGVLKTLDLSSIAPEDQAEFISNLRQDLKNLSKDSNSLVSGLENGFVRLSKIAEIAGQLGIAAEDIVDFTNVVGQLSLATNVSDEAGAFFLARFDSLTGLTGKFEETGSALVALGNNFAATESQIVEISERIVGAGNAAGFTQPQILAWGTAIRAVGIEAEAGGTSFNTLVAEITKAVSKGGEQLDYFAQLTNKTTEEFANSWRENASDTFEETIQALSELNNEELYAWMERLDLDGVRVQQFIQLLSSNPQILSEAIAIADTNFIAFGETIEEYNALQTEAANRTNTTESVINRLKNNAKGLSDTIGQFILPTFNKFLDAISAIFENIDNWIINNSEQFKAFLNIIGSTVTILGTSFIFLSGAVTGFLKTAGKMFLVWSSSVILNFANLFNVFKLFKLSIAGIVGIIPMLAGFTVGFTFLREIRDNTEGFNNAILRLNNAFGGLLKSILDFGKSLFDFFANLFGFNKKLDSSISPIKNSLNFISNIIERITSGIQRMSNILQVATFGLVGGNVNPDLLNIDKQINGENELNQIFNERAGIFEKLTKGQSQLNKTVQDFQVYTFQVGDTISGVAEKFGLSYQEILDYNNITLEDLMGNVSQINIPLNGINREFVDMKNNIEAITETPLDIAINVLDEELGLFETEDQKIRFLSNFNNELVNIKANSDEAKNALKILFTEPATSLKELKYSMTDFLVNLASIAALTIDRGQSTNYLTAASIGEGTENLINPDQIYGGFGAMSTENIVEKVFGITIEKIEESAKFVVEHFHNFLGLAFALVFTSSNPIVLSFSLGNILLDAISSDFMGLSVLNSPIVEQITKLRDTIYREIGNIFTSAIGGGKATYGDDLLNPNLVFENNTFGEQLGSSFKNIVEQFAETISAIVVEGIKLVPGIISFGIENFLAPILDAIFGTNTDVSGDTKEDVAQIIATLIRGAFEVLPNIITFTWNDVLSPIVDGITKGIVGEENVNTIAGGIVKLLAAGFAVASTLAFVGNLFTGRGIVISLLNSLIFNSFTANVASLGVSALTTVGGWLANLLLASIPYFGIAVGALGLIGALVSALILVFDEGAQNDLGTAIGNWLAENFTSPLLSAFTILSARLGLLLMEALRPFRGILDALGINVSGLSKEAIDAQKLYIEQLQFYQEYSRLLASDNIDIENLVENIIPRAKDLGLDPGQAEEIVRQYYSDLEIAFKSREIDLTTIFTQFDNVDPQLVMEGLGLTQGELTLAAARALREGNSSIARAIMPILDQDLLLFLARNADEINDAVTESYANSFRNFDQNALSSILDENGNFDFIKLSEALSGSLVGAVNDGYANALYELENNFTGAYGRTLLTPTGLIDSYVRSGLYDPEALVETFRNAVMANAISITPYDIFDLSNAGGYFGLYDKESQALEDFFVEVFENGEQYASQNTAFLSNAILEGLRGGLTSEEAAGIIGFDMGTLITDNFKEALEIQSPSGVFKRFGENIIDGLAIGVSEASSIGVYIINSLFSIIPAFSIFAKASFDSIYIVIGALEHLSIVLAAVGMSVQGLTGINLNVPSPQEITPPPPPPKPKGFRKFGGEVFANKMYGILEDNLPFELFRSGNNKTYMIPNTGGQMISPLTMGTVSSSNSSVNVNISIGELNTGGERINKDALANELSNIVKGKVGNNSLSDKLLRSGAV